ncbi:PulJ/GspJ family protein [Protaetiibacter larvae]|uniref:Prepilin-type N-terminal cleavage/methylation domain-containing protein n=1 Tax=Protaetiibacter larvae TaxID=2592654 RepID=A0A5C1Y611_9MICO|nr:hypothetical protein [Protaetiibacter larvae]QEO09226.1 hypothetical protein FLP23_03885 [Protaetiibacter larvae]
MTTSRAMTLREDRGVTMAEMLVVMLITTMILLAVGSMYIGTLRVEQTVVALSGSTNGAQLVARSIDDGVRNGVELRPIATGTDGGQLLVVCTAGAQAAISYKWQAWYYSPTGDGELRTKSFTTGLPPVVPDAAALETWTLLLTNIEPRGAANTVFTLDASDDTKVTTQFSTFGDDTDSATIDFATHLAPHPTYAPGSEPCS